MRWSTGCPYYDGNRRFTIYGITFAAGFVLVNHAEGDGVSATPIYRRPMTQQLRTRTESHWTPDSWRPMICNVIPYRNHVQIATNTITRQKLVRNEGHRASEYAGPTVWNIIPYRNDMQTATNTNTWRILHTTEATAQLNVARSNCFPYPSTQEQYTNCDQYEYTTKICALRRPLHIHKRIISLDQTMFRD